MSFEDFRDSLVQESNCSTRVCAPGFGVRAKYLHLSDNGNCPADDVVELRLCQSAQELDASRRAGADGKQTADHVASGCRRARIFQEDREAISEPD